MIMSGGAPVYPLLPGSPELSSSFADGLSNPLAGILERSKSDEAFDSRQTTTLT